MTALLQTALCVAAFALLALAMERHQIALFARALPANLTRTLRVGGWCGLVLTLWFVVGARGWALGLVDYSGVTSLSAGLVYGALIVHERMSASRRS